MDDNVSNDIKINKATEEDLSQDKPLSYGSYLDLPLTEEERDLHTSTILSRIDEILEDKERKEIMDAAISWRNQYYGVVGEKNLPWSSSFNLDTRLTPKIQDAVVAQTQEAFDDVDPRWSIGPVTNEGMQEVRSKQEKVLDAVEDQEMNNNEDLEAIRHDAFLLGLGWEAILFERKFERIRDYRIYNSLERFVQDFPNDYQKYTNYLNKLQNGESIKIVVDENREVRRSPMRKHVKFEDGICPLNVKGVEGVNNTDLRGRRVMMTYNDIRNLEEFGDYIKGVSEKLKYKPFLGNDGELIEDKEHATKLYETFEMIYDMYINVDGQKRKVRTLWNIEKEHGLCLRCIRYPYDHNRSYMIPHCIKYTNEGLYQDGMGRMLQDIHIAGNATINHILDAATLANSFSIKAREGSDAARRLKEHQWYPSSVLELQNMDDAQQFNFATPNLSALIQMFGIIEKFAQDVSGIVNYQMGVESPEDPEAPASKTIALMRKAEIKLRRYIKNLKRSEDEAGYQALRLIYQYVPIERLSEILGEDVAETKDFLKPSLRIITNASGFAIEKMFTKRDDQTMARTLLQDPLVAQDPVRRSKLWHIVAKSMGSNWDKKIIGIVPTPEEIQAEQEKAAQMQQMKKMDAIKTAATKVLEAGGSESEAREVGLQTGKNIDNMITNQQMQQPQPSK